jgi:hypothetical protein
MEWMSVVYKWSKAPAFVERWDTGIVGWNGYVAVAYVRDCPVNAWLAGNMLPAEEFVMRKHFVTLYKTFRNSLQNIS